MKYIFKDDAELTRIAKSVFGDIVEKAYMGDMYFRDTKPKKADFTAIKAYKGKDPTEIDNGRIVICIQYTNGRKVLMTNSEWGSIWCPNDRDLIQEVRR